MLVLRAAIPALLACSCFPLAAQEGPSATISTPQDLSRTVVPISEFKLDVHLKKGIARPSANPMSYFGFGVSGGGATGFCVDPECRFIGTNYHITLVGTPRKIQGQKIVQRYLATGPDDEGASLNQAGPLVGKYNLSRDLAIFELRHPLSKRHGIRFSFDDLQLGQRVDIYGYPKEGSNPFRRLLQFQGTFKGETTRGLLAFDYSLSSDGKAIRSGASGGIVVDHKTQRIVGILSAVASSGESVAMAVPVQSLADFLSKVQPYLAHTLFPTKATTVSPVAADFYPKFDWPRADGPQQRPEEPADVKTLRSKAQLMADSMRNFIAVQSFEWGIGAKDPYSFGEYEVKIVDGYQRFREYPDGKKEIEDGPLPATSNTAVSTGGEWSELPDLVGTNLGLKIHQAPDLVVNGRRIKVFQYQAAAEDSRCTFRSYRDFGLFSTHKDYSLAAHGEVWTDEDMNIIRISKRCELDGDGWKDNQSVVTYGWLKSEDELPRLIPLTISTQAEHAKKIYWCRGLFTNYQVFSTRTRIIAGEPAKGGPTSRSSSPQRRK